MKLGRMKEIKTPDGVVIGVYFPDIRFTSAPEHAAEVRRGGDGFPVERLDGGERQRATSQNVRLEGNSPMGVTPLRRTTSHHGNDGELVVTPIVSHEAEATLGRR